VTHERGGEGGGEDYASSAIADLPPPHFPIPQSPPRPPAPHWYPLLHPDNTHARPNSAKLSWPAQNEQALRLRMSNPPCDVFTFAGLSSQYEFSR